MKRMEWHCRMRRILSLCDFTGNWSQPYVDAGYDVVRVDLQHGGDVRLMEKGDAPVHGILAAPPLHMFCQFRRSLEKIRV